MSVEVKSFPELGLLSVEQLSRLMHKSPASIRSDASRNPEALPPICRLPGNKRLLWRIEDIAAFFASCVKPVVVAHFEIPSLASNQPKRRGRPRKTEVRV
ncbi:DNA-binding protein [Janthinobacterium aestuarii]